MVRMATKGIQLSLQDKFLFMTLLWCLFHSFTSDFLCSLFQIFTRLFSLGLSMDFVLHFICYCLGPVSSLEFSDLSSVFTPLLGLLPLESYLPTQHILFFGTLVYITLFVEGELRLLHKEYLTNPLETFYYSQMHV